MSYKALLKTRLRPKQAAACFFLLVAVFLLLLSVRIFAAPAEEIGIITVDYLNMRPEPSMDKPPIKTLARGTWVDIVQYLDGWIKVSHNGQSGYVRHRKKYLQIRPRTETVSEKREKPDENLERIIKEADHIQRKIQRSEQEVVTFSLKETKFINRLNEIDIALNLAGKQIAALKSELSRIEAAAQKSVVISRDLEKNIQITEAYASKRLVALYKLNRLGILHVLASADSIYGLFHRKAALERILAHDENTWMTLTENKAGLTRLLLELSEKKERKMALESTIKQQIQNMTNEQEKRKKMLDDIRNKKALEIAAISSLKQAALDLDETIRSLTEKHTVSVSVSRPETEKEPHIEADMGWVFKPFDELKGLLNMPVDGKIVAHFGRIRNTKFNIVNFRNGIDIQADRGEPVHAVCSGKVLYADWFKGYGNMLIIEHGNNYCTVYAHAEELFKEKGDVVEAGEVIATVGDSGSMVGPSLYFEVRHHGKPLDPLKWIKKG